MVTKEGLLRSSPPGVNGGHENGKGAPTPQSESEKSQEILQPTEVLKVKGLSAFYSTYNIFGREIKRQAVIEDFNFSTDKGGVLAIIGPSGSGKSSLLKCLNRMFEVRDKDKPARPWVKGEVMGVLSEGLGLEDLYAQKNPELVRRHFGMVFQQPEPSPNRNIIDEVLVGRGFWFDKRDCTPEVAEHYLRMVGLWDEVKDKLRKPGTRLSGGQQQRLMLARALALESKIVLMDEPTSKLDEIATLKIEEVIRSLSKEGYTFVIATHKIPEALRLEGNILFMVADGNRVGRMIEVNTAAQMSIKPNNPLTEAYITGHLEDYKKYYNEYFHIENTE